MKAFITITGLKFHFGSKPFEVGQKVKLFNQYGVMVVNPAKHPHVKAADAQKFVDWVVSPAGQNVIASYKIGGEQLFFPNAVAVAR